MAIQALAREMDTDDQLLVNDKIGRGSRLLRNYQSLWNHLWNIPQICKGNMKMSPYDSMDLETYGSLPINVEGSLF